MTWTNVDDLVATLKRRWGRGTFLRTYATGSPFEPIRLSVRGPTAAEMLDNPGLAIAWAARFDRDSCDRAGRPRFRVESRRIQSLLLGENHIPARVFVDTFGQLVKLVDSADEVQALDQVFELTSTTMPAALDWVTANPGVAAGRVDAWSDLLACVKWIAANGSSEVDIRHIDVAGVDTKFVERHLKLLRQILEVVLPPERVDRTQSR